MDEEFKPIDRADEEIEISEMQSDDIIDKITTLIKGEEKEGAAELLSAFDMETLHGVLSALAPDTRTTAVILLDKQVALALTARPDDADNPHYMHDMRSVQISEIVEHLYGERVNTSVTSLPSFAVQKILTHGTESARKIIAGAIAILVETKQLLKLHNILIELNPVDIAGIMDDFNDQDLLKLFRLMPKDMAADVFVYLPQDKAEKLISLLSDKEAGQIIDDLYADDAADFLEEMPSKVVKKLLAQAKPETRADINHLLQYKEDSAGSIMTVEFVDLKEDYTVAQAFERIRRDGVDKETINNCYVLDNRRKLVGMVTLRKLLLAKPGDKVGDIMEGNVIVVRTNADQEEVANLFKKYDFTSVPVCDSENRLVGIVTIDDIVDIIQEEAFEDVSLMGKVTPSDTEYLKTSVLRIWANRIPWLLVLMISATFTGLIISRFDDALLVLSSALFAYVPMLMGAGGNAGSQASVTVIRGMALGEIEWSDKFKVMWKEMRASLIIGACMSVVCFLKVIALDQFIYESESFIINAGQANEISGFAGVAVVGAIISLAVFITIMLAKFIGSLFPIFAKKIKLDPAVVVSPFITTTLDALSLLIYCNLAILLLG